MDLSKVRTDDTLSEEGVWFDLDSETRLRVARINNRRYSEVFRRKTQPYKTAIRRETLDDETANRIQLEVWAETILVGWEGLKEGGEDLPYTPENAMRILKEYDWIREIVEEVARSQEFYRLDEEEEEGKSSAPASSGNSSGARSGSGSKTSPDRDKPPLPS